MGKQKLDDVERWLIHKGLPFRQVKSPDSEFHIIINHTSQYGMPIEIFEPKPQPGVLVIGAKVIMSGRQTARYLSFNPDEKKRFEKKVADFCYSIQAINKNTAKDGKQKIGVYVVLDEKVGVSQQAVFDAIDSVAEMHEKTARFLLKTF